MNSHWQRWAIIVSIAWPIGGANAGVHLAVAPAISAYGHCMKGQAADASACQASLHRDWAQFSGDRLGYAALIGLAPIPFGWLMGWLVFAGQRPSRAAGSAAQYAGRGPAMAPLKQA